MKHATIHSNTLHRNVLLHIQSYCTEICFTTSCTEIC